jgi:hypothetical protein
MPTKHTKTPSPTRPIHPLSIHTAKNFTGQIIGVATNVTRSKPLRIISFAIIAVGLITLTAYSLCPRTVHFAWASDTCFVHPTFLPRLLSDKTDATYVAAPRTSLSIGGYPLYAHKICITPATTPKENTRENIAFGMLVFKKTVTVTTPAFPKLKDQAPLEKPLPINKPLTFQLDQPDQIFSYRVLAHGAHLDCTTNGDKISCDIPKLGLVQSNQYSLVLQRRFHQQAIQTIIEKKITTVEGLVVVGASIAADQTIYNAPSELTLTLNKNTQSVTDIHFYQTEGDIRKDVAITTTHKDNTITIHFTEPLARSASFTVQIEHITGSDDSYLSEPFNLSFKTSGGPKVLGISIGNYKVQPSGGITLTFDSSVAPTQVINNFIKIEAGAKVVASSLSIKGKTVTITPKEGLGRCIHFSVKVIDGLQNEAGIAGGSAWEFKSRTICQAVFSIGSSVQGRSISAYKFGSGTTTIVFVGTTHGDEKSSTYLLNKWVDYLETNYDRIPSDKTIIVIPNINPDGYAVGHRTNANIVDLNRNFPSNDWKQGVTMPDKSFNANGGGTAPLSEPETNALAGYITSVNPRLVLTYHAAAGVVIPNDSGDSESLAHLYDQKSNVGFASNGETDDIFAYDTTGALENWLHDKRDITALLVELWTKTGNEFNKHQAAMWAMIEAL